MADEPAPQAEETASGGDAAAPAADAQAPAPAPEAPPAKPSMLPLILTPILCAASAFGVIHFAVNKHDLKNLIILFCLEDHEEFQR